MSSCSHTNAGSSAGPTGSLCAWSRGVQSIHPAPGCADHQQPLCTCLAGPALAVSAAKDRAVKAGHTLWYLRPSMTWDLLLGGSASGAHQLCTLSMAGSPRREFEGSELQTPASRLETLSTHPGEACGRSRRTAPTQDLISSLLIKDPSKRFGTKGGSAEIMRHRFFEGLDFGLLHHAKPPQLKAPKKGQQSASNFESF